MPKLVAASSTVCTYISRLIIKYLLTGVLLGAVPGAHAQTAVDPQASINGVAGKLCKETRAKIARINGELLRNNMRCLQRMEAREEKIRKKLAEKGADTALFSQATGKYALLRKNLESGEQIVSRLHVNYIAGLDTLQAGLQFLTGTALVQPEQMQQLQHALGSIRQLQDRFGQTEEIEQFIEQRSQFLQQQLGKWGLTKEIKELQKQAYYYRAQVQQYKSLFNNPSKLEMEAFRLLKELSPFRQFFQSHSWLAAMFSLPVQGGETAPINPGGLQSRDLVAQSLAQRFGSPVQVQQLLRQQAQGAQPVIDQLKRKIRIPKSGGDEAVQLPRFHPNSQKTRRFRDRLELGSNVQTVKANRFFPSATDIGLSVGYKLNDKSIIGIGSAYRMGWGRSIRHISITHEGLGMRSFIDYQLKGNIWLSGGAEINYRSRFNNFEILDDYSAWQKSALIGISKKYKVSNKLKGNMQVLYDFLWKQQVPRTQALVFRIGYNFK